MTTRQSSHDTSSAHLDSLARFDDLIDVRTPAEFAEDHIPGAINAPVLSNDERVRIGTLYAQESAFQATRLGAALVARNLATHLETLFADKPRHWRPLVYCWRGGKRSSATVNWLNLIGWRACQLSGGYKTWRRHVITQLALLPQRFTFLVLTGPTGSGKTRLLSALRAAGAQTLDLEALARHRGSLLGALPHTSQPSQKAFESDLLQALSALDPLHPVFIEAESRRIGQVGLPDTLFQAMHASRCVQVQTSLPSRIAFLLRDYDHLFQDPEGLCQTLGRLASLHSHKTVAHWQSLVHAGQKAALFEALVTEHYDPAYRRSSRGHYPGLDQALSWDYDPSADNQHAQAVALLHALDLPDCPASGYPPTASLIRSSHA